jgi:hypothetical protein
MGYLTVDKKNVKIFKNPADAMPMFNTPSYKLNFPCTEKEYACNPEDYISALEKRISFDAKQKLVRTVLKYVK